MRIEGDPRDGRAKNGYCGRSYPPVHQVGVCRKALHDRAQAAPPMPLPGGPFRRAFGMRIRHTARVRWRDETWATIVAAASRLTGTWSKRARGENVIVYVNPLSRLFYRRWTIVEGFDLRVATRPNPPPEGLILGAHRSFLHTVRERRPFSKGWHDVQSVEDAAAAVERQIRGWMTETS
jgi:hypothetical protein